MCLIVARSCAPTTKVHAVQSLHRRDRIVAMTGDGVNDAPALKTADVGVAMGSGSEVTKQAGDIVLTDDNFASLVAAIEEGRRVFDNIKKFIVHEISSNIGSLLVLVISLAFRDLDNISINALSALQTIWINTIIVAMPSLALLREPPDPVRVPIDTSDASDCVVSESDDSAAQLAGRRSVQFRSPR